jgi:hypothetical protein
MHASRSRALAALTLATLVVSASLAAPPALADDPVVWTTAPGYPRTVDELMLSWESAESVTPFGTETMLEPVPIHRPEVENRSDHPRWFGIGSDFAAQGVVEPLWLAEPWGALEETMVNGGLLELFWFELGPGEKFSTDAGQASGWWGGMPGWSGHTITVFELSEAPVDGVTPSAIPVSSISTPGRHVPADLSSADLNNISAIMGSRATVAGGSGAPELFAGLGGTVVASHLPPGAVLELWIVKDFNYAFFQLFGGGLPLRAIKVGDGTVAADGMLNAPFALPVDLELGSYQLTAGVRAERYWPAGTWDDLEVKPPPNLATAEPTANGDGTSTAGFGSAAVTFPFEADGTTTLVESATGPIPVGFELATDPPVYFHLHTTVDLSGGEAEVCVAHGIPDGEDPPHLFHYDAALAAWVDISDRWMPGEVCGHTSSFSPFTLGYPDPFDFTGFFAPVTMTAPNLAKPGQAIPVKFSLAGDKGLEVVKSARFIVEGTDLTPDGVPLPADVATASGLSYDPSSDRYTYTWKTSKLWSLKTGTFELTLSDGTTHTFEATFKR